MPEDRSPLIDFGRRSQPFPIVTRALLEHIRTGHVTLPPNIAAEQKVALRLELDDDLMRDLAARSVVESHTKATAPSVEPKPWGQMRRSR